jgi:CheY-like chemotaxis protein
MTMAKVLVVDDDEDILGLVQVRLKRAGHLVMSAGSATAALALIDERGAPDVAVLDVGLPGLDGLELLDAIRERDGMAGMPAVFLSARVMPEDVQKGRDKGAIYLTKPFVASALLGAVDKALEEGSVEAADPGGW